SHFGSLTLCGTSGTCAIAAPKTSANHLGRRSKSHPGARPSSAGANNGRVCARRSQLLDLLAENDRLNVYAGELEVRPPSAPTTNPLAARKPPRPGTHAVRLRHESERSGRSTADQRRSVLTVTRDTSRTCSPAPSAAHGS